MVNQQSARPRTIASDSGEFLPLWIDPALLQVARVLYWEYCQTHTKTGKTPLGVVVDPKTYRGKVIAARQPILLPTEQFLPAEYIVASSG